MKIRTILVITSCALLYHAPVQARGLYNNPMTIPEEQPWEIPLDLPYLSPSGQIVPPDELRVDICEAQQAECMYACSLTPSPPSSFPPQVDPEKPPVETPWGPIHNFIPVCEQACFDAKRQCDAIFDPWSF